MSKEPDSSFKRSFRRSLLRWYDANKRDLPWRRSDDPYHIWLSEIMLQQTRVEAVIDYYERFLDAFPTVDALARAPQDRVLKLWEGLGYYSRARNLRKAAAVIANERGGSFPETVDEWMALPGIGRYSAGAICSIAFGVRAPVLDGNVKRVLARVFAIEEAINETRTVKRMWGLADELLAPRRPGDFNQAMMELGARVCLPRRPRCDDCPVVKQCRAHALELESSLPNKAARQTPPHVHVVAAAIQKNGRYLLGRRPSDGMLGGLWEFPGGKVESGESYEEALRRELHEELGVETRVGEHVISVDHAYTHLLVTIHLYRCEIVSGSARAIYHDAIKWVSRKRFGEYAFPKANLKFLDRL